MQTARTPTRDTALGTPLSQRSGAAQQPKVASVPLDGAPCRGADARCGLSSGRADGSASAIRARFVAIKLGLGTRHGPLLPGAV